MGGKQLTNEVIKVILIEPDFGLSVLLSHSAILLVIHKVYRSLLKIKMNSLK